MIRIRRGLRQADVAQAADLSRATIARHENGHVRSVDALERHAAVLDLRLEIRMWGRGGETDRLSDEEHAAIVELVASRFREADWLIEIEVSFNDRGDRGRIDLLVSHASDMAGSTARIQAAGRCSRRIRIGPLGRSATAAIGSTD